jgi:hypothetical protein
MMTRTKSVDRFETLILMPLYEPLVTKADFVFSVALETE